MTKAQKDALDALYRNARSVFSVDVEDDDSLLINWTNTYGHELQTQILPDGTVL